MTWNIMVACPKSCWVLHPQNKIQRLRRSLKVICSLVPACPFCLILRHSSFPSKLATLDFLCSSYTLLMPGLCICSFICLSLTYPVILNFKMSSPGTPLLPPEPDYVTPIGHPHRALFFPFHSTHYTYEFPQGLHSPIYLYDNYFQNPYYVPGIILEAGDAVVDKISYRPYLWHILVTETINK